MDKTDKEPKILFCYRCERVAEFTMPTSGQAAKCPYCGTSAAENERLRDQFFKKYGKLHERDVMYDVRAKEIEKEE